MAIDITKGSHKVAFPSKVASAQSGSPHVYNITLDADHDNGDLVIRDTASWNSFDNYDEGTGTLTFSGIIREDKGVFYVEVVSAGADVVMVYNAPVSPYSEKDLQDESLFYNAEGDVVQGLSLIKGDIIELSADAFSSTPVEDKTVTYNATTNKYVVAS